MPQPICPLHHARIRSILLFKDDWFKDLERTPSVVHKDFDIQVIAIVTIHREPGSLRQRIDDGGMGVEIAVLLHTGKAQTTRSLQCLAVHDKFIDGAVVVVEAR